MSHQLPEGIPPAVADRLHKFGRLAEEFHRETDRGCAILVGCILEDYLRDLIRALLPDPTADMRRLAPPGGIGAAIESATILGLLTARQANSFRQVVAVRNKFAHSVLENLKFAESPVRELVDVIQPAVDYPVGVRVSNDTPRGWFLMHAGTLCILMLLRTVSVGRLVPAQDFDASKGLPPGLLG